MVWWVGLGFWGQLQMAHQHASPTLPDQPDSPVADGIQIAVVWRVGDLAPVSALCMGHQQSNSSCELLARGFSMLVCPLLLPTIARLAIYYLNKLCMAGIHALFSGNPPAVGVQCHCHGYWSIPLVIAHPQTPPLVHRHWPMS